MCSDMEMMKERFSKLLLGEDMSGGGKGVSSALALSNSITNLAGIHLGFLIIISIVYALQKLHCFCQSEYVSANSDATSK